MAARKYRGKYPTRICEVVVYHSKAPGVAHVKTNDGAYFSVLAKNNNNEMPRLGKPISDYVVGVI